MFLGIQRPVAVFFLDFLTPQTRIRDGQLPNDDPEKLPPKVHLQDLG
jgi:hypothetical protein